MKTKTTRHYVAILMAALACLALITSGCATTGVKMTGPELKKAAITYLEKDSTKATIKSALVIAGSQLLTNQVKDPAERTKIADEMYGLSKSFYSLATGELVTPSMFDAAVKSHAPGLSCYSSYTAVFNLGWSLIYPKLVLSGDPKLGMDYLLLMAQAAEEVAEPYRSK